MQRSSYRSGSSGPSLPGTLGWLAAGGVAGSISGVLVALAAVGASAAAGLPWHRPLTLVASVAYGPQIALASGLDDGNWLWTAAGLIAGEALAWGLVYGALVAALGERPGRGLAVRLGLLVGLSAWLITAKGILPLAAPLALRMVPGWSLITLFALYGLGLAAAAATISLLSRERTLGGGRTEGTATTAPQAVPPRYLNEGPERRRSA